MDKLYLSNVNIKIFIDLYNELNGDIDDMQEQLNELQKLIDILRETRESEVE